MNSNHKPQSNGVLEKTDRRLKLSPDSVALTDLCTASSALVVDNFLPVKRDEFNMPPLQATPLKPQGRKLYPPNPRLQLPKLPPPLPPKRPIATRQSSEPVTRNTNEQRRSIFGQYWGNSPRSVSTGNVLGSESGFSVSNSAGSSSRGAVKSKDNGKVMRQRSSSLSIFDSSAPHEPTDYRMFAPPLEFAVQSAICSRFDSVETGPMLESLPPLPAPLKRLCSEDSTTRCLHGMYPLVTPVPILKQSSYRSFFGNKGGSSITSKTSPSGTSRKDSFNLTKSIGPMERFPSFDVESTCSSSTSNKSSGVHFDPRVTVTEFEDSVQRSWYDDADLERFKQETVLIAQEYLLTHPKEAEKYNRAKLDPITGTYRKKALFSLPVLKCILEDKLPKPDCREFKELIENQVRNILVVDPNASILHLFRKSMYSMFPTANIVTTQSGEEALGMVCAELQREYGCSPLQHRNFDIIIVEQRLYQQAKDVPTPLPAHKKSSSALPHNKSTLGIPELGQSPRIVSFTPLQRPNSFVENMKSMPHCCINMSGSELLKAIQEMEVGTFADPTTTPITDSCSAEASSISTKPFQWRALLVGVSIQPDRDARTLQDAGADVIWGKPIPKVGDALRNQLLNALISKRTQSRSEEC